ncbi:MAG: adenine phosphoribosyltransferase [Halanaerobiaceae bacterium]
MKLMDVIREIHDFPKEGIVFKDITTLLKNGDAFREAIELMCDHYKDHQVDYIVGVEARGFIVGAPMALAMGKGFIPVRKPGKLPGDTILRSYDLEYGSNAVEIHSDAFEPGDKILIIDDLLATGGTVAASAELIEELGGDIQGIGFLLELSFLNGRDKLKGYDVFTLLKE